MSHSHSHGPGDGHSHSHSHSHSPSSPQTPAFPAPDPKLQTLIEQDFQPLPVGLSADKNTAVCANHGLEKCDSCDVDFVLLNRLSNALLQHPTLLCPPPGNVITPKITQLVTATKEEGNNLFKSAHYAAAITRYSAAAAVAVSRPPWESNQLMCEELSTVISNRSAAYFESRDYISALTDAETVIQIRRKWSKGHFRKAKALLGLTRTKDAADAVKLGLSFEPTNTELSSFLAEIERFEKCLQDAKKGARQGKT